MSDRKGYALPCSRPASRSASHIGISWTSHSRIVAGKLGVFGCYFRFTKPPDSLAARFYALHRLALQVRRPLSAAVAGRVHRHARVVAAALRLRGFLLVGVVAKVSQSALVLQQRALFASRSSFDALQAVILLLVLLFFVVVTLTASGTRKSTNRQRGTTKFVATGSWKVFR